MTVPSIPARYRLFAIQPEAPTSMNIYTRQSFVFTEWNFEVYKIYQCFNFIIAPVHKNGRKPCPLWKIELCKKRNGDSIAC